MVLLDRAKFPRDRRQKGLKACASSLLQIVSEAAPVHVAGASSQPGEQEVGFQGGRENRLAGEGIPCLASSVEARESIAPTFPALLSGDGWINAPFLV